MKWFLSLMMVLVFGLTWLIMQPAPAMADVHWAQPEVDLLTSTLGWTPPAGLDEPISPKAWNELMALVVGEKAGPATAEEGNRRWAMWFYTGGMFNTETLERQHAIGGLVKLVGVFYQKQLLEVGEARLSGMPDGARVVDWQRPLVEKAVSAYLVFGYPNGEFRPTAPLLVGEAASLAARVFYRFGQAQPVPPSTGPWAPDGTIPMMPNRGGAGRLTANVTGAQYASALPGAGPAAPGHLWVLLDVELINESETESLPLATGVAFSIEDAHQWFYHYDMDRAATAAIGSPLASAEGVLQPGQRAQGKAVFAVPVGTKGFWFRIDHRLGAAKGKDWAGMMRSLVGDLPGAERVFAHGIAYDSSIYQVAGIYATRAEAEAVTSRARLRRMPAFIEAQPDGRYAAYIVFEFFDK